MGLIEFQLRRLRQLFINSRQGKSQRPRSTHSGHSRLSTIERRNLAESEPSAFSSEGTISCRSFGMPSNGRIRPMAEIGGGSC